MATDLKREITRLHELGGRRVKVFADLAEAQVRASDTAASRIAADKQFSPAVWAIVPICTDIEIERARRQGHQMATRLGCSSFDATLIATVVSELARTIVAGAWQGKIVLDGKRKNASAEITIRACVKGPALAALARQNGHGGELGAGLRAVQRIMDEFEVLSHPARGTTLIARKWVQVSDIPYKLGAIEVAADSRSGVASLSLPDGLAGRRRIWARD